MESLVIVTLTFLVLLAFVGMGWALYRTSFLLEKEREAHRKSESELTGRIESFARHEQEEVRGLAGSFQEALSDLTTKIKASSLEEVARYQVAVDNRHHPHHDSNREEILRRLSETLSPEQMEHASTDPAFLEMVENAVSGGGGS